MVVAVPNWGVGWLCMCPYVVGRVWSSNLFPWVLELLSNRMVSSSVLSNRMVSSSVEFVRHLPLSSSSSSSSSSLGASQLEVSCCSMLISFPGVLGILASRMVLASGAFVRQPSSSSSFCAFRLIHCIG